MGLIIGSADGLVSARGYGLVLLTFGLAGLSPEEDIVRRHFHYMSDALGRDGMIVTGGFDSEFRDDPNRFLRHVVEEIYGEALSHTGLGTSPPIPALVALRPSDLSPVEVGYYAIENLAERDLIALFRRIATASEKEGGIREMSDNVLGNRRGPVRKVWKSLVLQPNVMGIGVDLKNVVSRSGDG